MPKTHRASHTGIRAYWIERPDAYILWVGSIVDINAKFLCFYMNHGQVGLLLLFNAASRVRDWALS